MSTRSNPEPNTVPGRPSFHEFRKQASFFLREKIKTARLALTDVTPAQLLAEEVISRNSPGSPDSPSLYSISRAAFEVDDYWRIVGVLHQRFDIENWRAYYNTLIVLEHLLAHGPESVAYEFQTDKDVIAQCGAFQYIDEKGFNWGLSVRKKSDRVQKLLENGPLLREERERSRKLKRGIQGFGSFCVRTSAIPVAYVRSNSDHGMEEDKSKERMVRREEAAESKWLLVGKQEEEWRDDDDVQFNDEEILSHSLLA